MVFLPVFVLSMSVKKGIPKTREMWSSRKWGTWQKQGPLDVISKFVHLDIRQKSKWKHEHYIHLHVLECELKYTHINTQTDMWTVDANSVVLTVTALLLYVTLSLFWGNF